MAKKKKTKKKEVTHVKMQKGDIVADVHVNEIENYAKGGYKKVK